MKRALPVLSDLEHRWGRRLRPGDLYVIPGNSPEDVYQVLRVSECSALVRPRRGRHEEFIVPDVKTGEERRVSFDKPANAYHVSAHALVRIVGHEEVEASPARAGKKGGP